MSNGRQLSEIGRELLVERQQAVVNSALWAAAGDALGWITELSRGPSGVAHRAGVERVVQPVKWQRLIGGRGGPRVDLPAGTYSDDTQLRLAVSRSIRGDGYFDVETFAKIEITVWPTYALGGGLGTKAAAANLSKRSVNWFSNFFETSGQSYVSGGGNGAAMRIQPHVWCSSEDTRAMLLNVLRDSLVTHGHPHGFCGALFHSLCLRHVMVSGAIPAPNDWVDFIDSLSTIPKLIDLDPQLTMFWRSAWENATGLSISDAVSRMQSEARADLAAVSNLLTDPNHGQYKEILDRLGCLTASFRGSGFKTALAAAALAHLHRDNEPQAALIEAANVLESDTDTIATMAGALLGAAYGAPPEWALQDRSYICEEANRLSLISLGVNQSSFSYPDLSTWNAPSRQTESVGLHNGSFAIAGLGSLNPESKEYSAGDAVWQWFSLPFGQSILAKRKARGELGLLSSQMPEPIHQPPATKATDKGNQLSPKLNASSSSPAQIDEKRRTPELKNPPRSQADGIDAWTDEVIQSDFDNFTLGLLLNRCIEQSESVESAIAFSAIVAKAKLARQRRRR